MEEQQLVCSVIIIIVNAAVIVRPFFSRVNKEIKKGAAKIYEDLITTLTPRTNEPRDTYA